MMKIGCCVDVCDAERVIAQGFDFVDLNGQELASMPLEAVRALADRLGRAPCIGLHATVPARVRLAGPDFSLAAAAAYFQGLAERARLLRVRYLGIGSPRSRSLPSDFPVARADAQMRDALRAAATAYPEGQILLESLNPTETNYINSLAHAARVIEGLDPARIGLVLDVFHFALCGERPGALTDAIAARVRYIHIADPVRRSFPSASTDPALLDFVRDAARRAGVTELAIEAGPSDLAKESEPALKVLRRLN